MRIENNINFETLKRLRIRPVKHWKRQSSKTFKDFEIDAYLESLGGN